MGNKMDIGKNVVAITLNWNGKEFIEDCIDALLSTNYEPLEIIVVDNGSTDGSVRFLKEKFGESILIIENGENFGYSRGFNVGFRKAQKKGADYILVLNNDTVINSNAIKELVNVFELFNDAGFVTGKVYDFYKPNVLQTIGRTFNQKTFDSTHIGSGELDQGQYDDIKVMESIDDVFMMVRKEVIERIGGYDPIYYLYWEETDWLERGKIAGYNIYYTPRAKLWHKGSLSSGGRNNPIKTFWISRNRYLFIWRHGTPQQWNHFLLKQVFYRIPISVFTRLVKGNSNLFISYFRGNLSGLIWVLRNMNENLKDDLHK